MNAGVSYDENIKKTSPNLGLVFADRWLDGRFGIALGLSGFRRPTFHGYVDDLDNFGKIIKNYGPFWCAFSVPGEHAVIVNGVDLDRNKVLVVNPYSGSGMAEQETYDPAAFQRRLGSKDIASAAQMFFD